MEPETSVVIALAKLISTFSNVTLGKKDLYKKAGLETGHIGLGSFDTWHGTPDMRATPVPKETPDLSVNLVVVIPTMMAANVPSVHVIHHLL